MRRVMGAVGTVILDTQVDIKDNSWSFEAGLRPCQNNSSSIRNGGKGISFFVRMGTFW